MIRAMIFAIALLGAALFPFAQSSESPDVGKIDMARGSAVLIRDKKVSDVKTGDFLKLNDIVQIGRGSLQIALKDGSTLNLSRGGELRVILQDSATQVTLIEMLHGHVRAHVASITKASGSFEIRTPTARVRALGTVVSVATQNVETSSAVNPQTINQQALDQLPINGRDFTSLIQLTPGTASGTSGRLSLSDYGGVKSTGVWAEDHFASITNFNLQIPGETDLLPGEFTTVPKNLPPQPATPMYLNGNNYSQEFKDFRLNYSLDYSRGGTRTSDAAPQTTPQTPPRTRNPGCGQGSVIDGTYVPLNPPPSGTSFAPPQFHYEVVGTTGISTGLALQIHFFNDSPCSLKFVVTNGAILRPAGYVGRVIEGLLIGTAPLTDFQRMYTLGGKVFLKPTLNLNGVSAPHPEGDGTGLVPVSMRTSVVAPAGTDATMMLRSFCVQLHKLAPIPKTAYKFADTADQQKYSPNRVLVDRAFHMVLTRKITLPPGQSMDNLVQWLLWKNIEGLNEKTFHEEFFHIVKGNYEAQKKKWNKDSERETDRLEQDLWNNIQKVLSTTN